MMLLERWLVTGILGLTMPMVLTAGAVSSPQQRGQTQDAVPAKAVVDPDAPPPPPPGPPAKAEDDQDLKANPDDDPDAQRAAEPAAQPVAQPVPAPVEVEKSQPAQAPAPAAAPPAPAPPAAAPEQGKQGKYDQETAQLLHLVQELKVEVDKAGANTLSLAALRRADEIQRLAKDLKERMKEQGQTVASKSNR